MKLFRGKFLFLAAVGLPAVFALTWWTWWAEAPPPTRVIPPEAFLKLKEEVRLRNERLAAEDGIDRSISYVRTANASSFFKSDTTAVIERLREALQTDNANNIAAYTADLDNRVPLLSRAAREIEIASGFLSDFSVELSPLLRKQVEEAIVSVQQALEGQDWDRLRASSDALGWLNSNRLGLVKSMYSLMNSLEELGTKVNPTLRQQMEMGIAPLRQALKGGSWDQVAETYGQLSTNGQILRLYYPSRILGTVQMGRRMVEELQPSEQKDLKSALDAVDTALQGESWEEASARAQDVYVVGNRIRNTLGHNGSLASPCVRVLSIDGGGIRGIIPAIFLTELESRAKAPIAKLFDYIVGTSTGGIIALGLAAPDPNNPGKPLHTAKELVALYEDEGSNIFPGNPLKSIRGLFWPKYRAEGIEQVLKSYFGDELLGSALTNVMIPTYALGVENIPEELREKLNEKRHVFLSSYVDESSFIYMWEAARAASAAPTYFPPFQIPVPSEGGGSIALIDGGVFANNPTAYAISIVKRREYNTSRSINNTIRYMKDDGRHPLLLLSLGTGRAPRSIAFRDAWSWGDFRWLGPILDITLSDPGIEDEARQLMGLFDLYSRLQPTLKAPAELDNTDKKNIEALKEAAKQYIDLNSSTFDQLVTQLTRERPPECERRIGP